MIKKEVTMVKKLFTCIFLFSLIAVSSCAFSADQPIGEIPGALVLTDVAAKPSQPLPPNNLNDQFLGDLSALQGAPLYTLDITLQEEEGIFRINGSQQVRYTNQETEPLDAVYFKLVPNFGGDYLAVSNMTVDSAPVEPQLEFENTVMRIDLPAPLPAGRAVVIDFLLDAVVPSEMGGNYGLFVFQDNVLALDAFFPIIPVYNDEGWNVESPPQNADVIFSDAAFFAVTVDAAEDLVIAAGGQEMERSVESGRQIVTYHAGPQRDFYLAASPDFVKESVDVDGVTLTSYFPEKYRESGLFVLEIAQIALQSYSERFGPYPFTELDLVSTPMQAGGMEYSSITALGLYLYDPAYKLSGGLPGSVFLEAAAAHEVAHMWFYCQVMNDQIDHPWQDESLVQYATYLYYLDRYGEKSAQEFQGSFYDRWDRVGREPISIGLPAAQYEGAEYSAIIYGRGVLMFEAMQEVMGEDAFNQFLKDYVEKFRWQVVEPEDLLETAENACDCDLSAVYQEWGVR